MQRTHASGLRSLALLGLLGLAPLLGGVVTFATSPLGMTGQRGQFPSSGLMTVHGVNSSTVRITAIDRFTAQVDIDADGDFVFETSDVRQWIHLVH